MCRACIAIDGGVLSCEPVCAGGLDEEEYAAYRREEEEDAGWAIQGSVRPSYEPLEAHPHLTHCVA